MICGARELRQDVFLAARVADVFQGARAFVASRVDAGLSCPRRMI